MTERTNTMFKKQMPETGTEIEKFCAFCEHGTPVPGTDDVVCIKKGVVKADFVCRRFQYDPLKRNPKEKIPLPEMEAVSLDD